MSARTAFVIAVAWLATVAGAVALAVSAGTMPGIAVIGPVRATVWLRAGSGR